MDFTRATIQIKPLYRSTLARNDLLSFFVLNVFLKYREDSLKCQPYLLPTLLPPVRRGVGAKRPLTFQTREVSRNIPVV